MQTAPALEFYAPKEIVLPDGAPLRLRAIVPDDAPRLQAFVARLSPQTLFLRTLVPMKTLSDRDARRLATVDCHRRMALIATTGDGEDETIVGVARYATLPGDAADHAEIAIVVEDGYQGRSLGTVLLKELAVYARAHGIAAFTAAISSENARVRYMIERTGLPTEIHNTGYGEQEVRILLRRQE
ncbi:MAG: GNAT family N-acetyltransferase [Anaerolineae bacterium]